MYSMFRGCRAGEINLGDKFDIYKVTDMDYMFYRCEAEIINLGYKFDIYKAVKNKGAFEGCKAKSIISKGKGVTAQLLQSK